MRPIISLLNALRCCTRGATAVEYGFILALIVLAMIAALTELASSTTGMWNNVAEAVTAAR